MTGFDRPLKPRWIYEFLQVVKTGERISDYNEDLRKITWELDGKEGKRKVRTVLSRYFLKEQDNPRALKVADTRILRIAKNYSLEEIKPLLLFNMLVRSKMMRLISRMIKEIYGVKNPINYEFLREKIIEKFGERDISARSLRNFLHTLEYFGILEERTSEYRWKHLLEVNEITLVLMLKLYSEEYLHSSQIIFEEIEDYIFMYFKLPDMNKIAKKYHNLLWDYTKMFNKGEIVINNSYDWDLERLEEVVE